ncbi:pleckstrin homology (PH) domain superfamily protein [Tasmannia lanceolata]|uniref:pleckstrin homology (PH) domain superfamily protein n=1 Tax=Tasmannia lanceolata TaxID=3420 RepID=UPI004062822F
MGTKRLGPSDSNLDSTDSALRSKRIMPAPTFDAHRAESSRRNLTETLPPLDSRRAESACLHVRALNTQFASWVQLQLQNHPDELWQDGVQDYLTHASQIMEKFRDVVDWLKANAAKAESVSIKGSNAEKNPVAEAKNKEVKLQPKDHSGFSRQSSPVTFAPVTFANSWSSGSFSSSQTSILPGNSTLVKQEASEDLDDENDLEQPSSPSLKKTEEQGILIVHETKCKVYVKPDNPKDGAWKDMGMGQLSIKCKEGASKATKESKPTIVIRNDVGKVLLNALIYPGIKMTIQKNTIMTIFHTLGVGNATGSETGNDAVAVARTYLLRLKTVEDTNNLAVAIKEYAPAA